MFVLPQTAVSLARWLAKKSPSLATLRVFSVYRTQVALLRGSPEQMSFASSPVFGPAQKKRLTLTVWAVSAFDCCRATDCFYLGNPRGGSVLFIIHPSPLHTAMRNSTAGGISYVWGLWVVDLQRRCFSASDLEIMGGWNVFKQLVTSDLCSDCEGAPQPYPIIPW